MPSPDGPETILVVEDEVLVRMVICEYLRDCGYRVIEAAGADEAMLVLQQDDLAIDAVLSDVEMPGSMDGFGLARWIRLHRTGLDVILVGNPQRRRKPPPTCASRARRSPSRTSRRRWSPASSGSWPSVRRAAREACRLDTRPARVYAEIAGSELPCFRSGFPMCMCTRRALLCSQAVCWRPPMPIRGKRQAAAMRTGLSWPRRSACGPWPCGRRPAFWSNHRSWRGNRRVRSQPGRCRSEPRRSRRARGDMGCATRLGTELSAPSCTDLAAVPRCEAQPRERRSSACTSAPRPRMRAGHSIADRGGIAVRALLSVIVLLFAAPAHAQNGAEPGRAGRLCGPAPRRGARRYGRDPRTAGATCRSRCA